ncbi:MAG: hypothetical protein JKY27_04200 [Magnetovibrio sp.]|nr:hypothetical protein [Magnetovibrio sp.]
MQLVIGFADVVYQAGEFTVRDLHRREKPFGEDNRVRGLFDHRDNIGIGQYLIDHAKGGAAYETTTKASSKHIRGLSIWRTF